MPFPDTDEFSEAVDEEVIWVPVLPWLELLIWLLSDSYVFNWGSNADNLALAWLLFLLNWIPLEWSSCIDPFSEQDSSSGKVGYLRIIILGSWDCIPITLPRGDMQQLLDEFDDKTDCWEGDLISKLHSLPLPDAKGGPSTGDIGVATGMATFWFVRYDVRRLRQLGRIWPKQEDDVSDAPVVTGDEDTRPELGDAQFGTMLIEENSAAVPLTNPVEEAPPNKGVPRFELDS